MKLAVAALALSGLVACASPGRTGRQAEPHPADRVAGSALLPARVREAAEERVAAGWYPALVIGVVDGEESRVYGFGEGPGGKEPDADTVFEIGSVTKTFTALLLARCVTSGRVSLDEPLAQLLPGFSIPARDDKAITLEALATHFSGLPRLPANIAPPDTDDPYAHYDAAKLQAFLAAYQLPRDPGASYEYSNLGYGLLGFALAHRGHTSYRAMMQEQILEPLHLASTDTTLSEEMRAHLAPGHDASGTPTSNWTFEALAGAGALRSTAGDMLRYLRANMGSLDTPLRAAMELAQKPRRSVAADERVGLAWMTRHDADGDVVWHNGQTGGYASFIGFTADRSRGVVVLANAAQSVDDLGFATLLPHEALVSAARALHLDAATLDAYVGDYRLAPKFVLSIVRQGDQLLAKATGQAPSPIYPKARDEFFSKAVDATISFQRDESGAVTGLVLHQHGDHPAPRISAVEAAAATSGTPIVTLPAETLAAYAGTYQLAPGAVFTITVEGQQLFAQLTGQPRFPVFAASKDHFFFTIVDAQIDFVRDDEGRVVALVLHQNGADHRAPRTEGEAR